MKIHGTVSVIAAIEINEKEAEVLNHLTDFAIGDWFTGTCSREMTADYIRETLRELHVKTSTILKMKKAAEDQLKPSKEESST